MNICTQQWRDAVTRKYHEDLAAIAELERAYGTSAGCDLADNGGAPATEAPKRTSKRRGRQARQETGAR